MEWGGGGVGGRREWVEQVGEEDRIVNAADAATLLVLTMVMIVL